MALTSTDEVFGTRTPLEVRVAALLMLLYAQPIGRLTRLTIDDILNHDDEVFVRLGDPPTPVPEPFAGLLLEQTANRRT